MDCLIKELLQTYLYLDKPTQVFITSFYQNCGLISNITSASIKNYELQLEYITANTPSCPQQCMRELSFSSLIFTGY